MSDFIIDLGRLLNPIDYVLRVLHPKILILTIFRGSLLYLNLRTQLAQIIVCFIDNLKNSRVLSGVHKLVVFGQIVVSKCFDTFLLFPIT